MNYMTIIRKFLIAMDNCATDINNQSLGITIPKSTRACLQFVRQSQKRLIFKHRNAAYVARLVRAIQAISGCCEQVVAAG